MKGWEYFDADLYARHVLVDAPLRNGFLDVPTSRLLSAAPHITHLRSLRLFHRTVGDLSFLRGFDQPLKELRVGDLQSGDLSPLTSCAENLEKLYIWADAVIQDFAPLLSLRKLTSFGLWADDLTGLEFVRQLPQLRQLHLGRLEQVTDLSPLWTQTSLSGLAVEDCSELTELHVLPPLGDLTFLSLARSSLVCSLHDLVERAPRLGMLHIASSSWVNDLNPLTALQLTHLDLWGCREITDFAPLTQMTGLGFLDLGDTSVQDLTPLAGLTRLEWLGLRKCAGVSDLAPLGALRDLRDLYIEDVASGIDLAPVANNRRLTVYIARGQEVRNRKMFKGRIQIG